MIKGIKNIANLLLQDMINFIHFNPKKTGDKEVINLSLKLQKEGIIKINKYISPTFSDDLRKEVEALAQKNPVSTELENKTKFNYRSQNNPNGRDYGMLDIFNVENSIERISEINQTKIIEIIKNATGQEVKLLRINAYLNEGIENTRGYHIDNTQPVIFKGFIYLSDVKDVSFGPYSFVKKSHRLSLYPYLNLFRNLFNSKRQSTDMLIHKKNEIVDVLGEKGDLILSNQNGIHRGLPQNKDRKRVVLVLTYLVKSRMSYLSKTTKDMVKQRMN